MGAPWDYPGGMALNWRKVVLVVAVLATIVALAALGNLDDHLPEGAIMFILGHVLGDGRTFIRRPPLDQVVPPKCPDADR